MKTTTFEIDALLQAEPAVLLYFYNDQCAPCQALRPKVEQLLMERFTGMRLEFINAAGNSELTARHQVFAAPTLLVFFEGREYIRESKYVSVSELEEKIMKYYRMMEWQ